MAPPPPRRRPVPRKPPPRRRKPPTDRTVPRIVAGVAVAALLVVAILAITFVTGGGGDDTSAAQDGPATRTAERTATPTRTPTPKAARTPKPLTSAQRETRSQAAQTVADRGYRVVRLRDFEPRKTLQVLIGRSRSGNALAFFFVDGEYIGNDSTSSSARITKRRGGGKTSAVLRYGIFAPGDAPQKPTGTPIDVTFRWDGTRLEPSPALPPVPDRSR